MKKMSIAEAKNKLPELIRAVEAGERITICRRGVPVVDLVRTTAVQDEKPRLGSLRGQITINDPDWWKPLTDQEAEQFLEGNY